VVPAVPAKPVSVAKAPPSTADWLTGALSHPKRGGRESGWSRAEAAVAAVAATTRADVCVVFSSFFP